ncbi:MAG: peptidylprolyl isomerase [Bacteroidota bacterium]
MNCVLILSLLARVSAFSQVDTLDDTPLAKVGSSAIGRSEFVIRYESTPGPQRQIESRKEINKEVFLFSMISERLLAEEARRQGLEADLEYQEAVKEVEDPIVRDELYQEEVREKIVNTPGEIEEAMAKSHLQLNVYIVSAATKSGADFLESRIKAGMKLEEFSFVHDTPGEFVGPDSMTVHWGDDNQDIEKAAYALKLGETSKPIQFGDGWYIIKIMGESISSGGGLREDVNAKKRVEEILTRRKEAVRMVEYLQVALKDKMAQANGKLFAELSGSMFNINQCQEKTADSTGASKFILTGEVYDSLSILLSPEWNDVFVTFPKSQWTLGKAVEKIFGQGFGVADPTSMKIKVTLDQALRNLIYQEELTEIAYGRDLEMNPRVQGKISMWKNFYLANLLKERIVDTVKTTDTDVKNYMANMVKDSTRLEMVKLKELIIQDPGTAFNVSNLLSKREPFEKVALMFAEGSEFGNRERTGYFTISELGGLGVLLKDVPIGGCAGPVHTHDGYIFAELLDREHVSPLTKDPGVDLNMSARKKLISDRLKYLTDNYVAQLADNFGVDIYANRLAGTHVTSLPMLMFQLLGFGGRMFACPLIVPEASWVQYWDVKKHLLP